MNLTLVGRGSRRAALDLPRLRRSVALPSSWPVSRSRRNKELPMNRPFRRAELHDALTYRVWGSRSSPHRGSRSRFTSDPWICEPQQLRVPNPWH